MRIFKIAQVSSKIPVEFDGIPLSGDLIQVLTELDGLYSLTESEIKWILESFNFLVTLTSQPDWGRVVNQLQQLFVWARETGTYLPMTDSGHDLILAKAYFRNQRLEQVFSRKPWAITLLKDQTEWVQEAIMELERTITNLYPDGLTQNEIMWILSKANIDGHSPEIQRNLVSIVHSYRSMGEELTNQSKDMAMNVAYAVEAEERAVELSHRLSNSGLRTVDLSGGWKAIWVDPHKRALRPDEANISDDADDELEYEYQVEREITLISLGSSDYLISIRDPNNVPRASIEISPNTSEASFDIDVYEISGNSEGKAKIQELREILKKEGSMMLSANDEIEVSTINELVNEIYNADVLSPVISLGRDIGSIGSSNYKEAIDWVYHEGWSGSYYSAPAVKRGFDALVEYAKQRGELHSLSNAIQTFQDDSYEQWIEYENQLFANGQIPDRPEEDDPKFNKGGKFNQKAYNKVQKDYDQAIDAYQNDFEPYQLSNYAYKQLQAMSPDLDAETAKDEKVKQRKEQIALEKERKKREAERLKQEEEQRKIDEEKRQQFEKEVGDYGKRFQTEVHNSFFEDNELTTAFDINWRKTS